MGEMDWAYLNDGLDIATVDRGVTAGITAPPGGDSFVYAFNSLAAVKGSVALMCALQDFAPMAKGVSIRGCIQRGPGGGPVGFSPFFYACCQGNSVHDSAYLLGLSDEEPCRLLLRKGMLSAGVGDADIHGALLVSSGAVAQGEWVHVRLDVIVNANADVVLKVFENDLSSQPLGSAPDWQPVAGMHEFIDDHLGINSGSQPLTSGYGGFGFATEQVTRRGFFDHIEVWRQQ